jgi:hypothetical protein
MMRRQQEGPSIGIAYIAIVRYLVPFLGRDCSFIGRHFIYSTNTNTNTNTKASVDMTPTRHTFSLSFSRFAEHILLFVFTSSTRQAVVEYSSSHTFRCFIKLGMLFRYISLLNRIYSGSGR